MLHISALRGMLVADTTYKKFAVLDLSEQRTGGSTVALFRAGGYVGNTYMQMKLHHITAQIPPTSISKENKP